MTCDLCHNGYRVCNSFTRYIFSQLTEPQSVSISTSEFGIAVYLARITTLEKGGEILGQIYIAEGLVSNTSQATFYTR